MVHTINKFIFLRMVVNSMMTETLSGRKKDEENFPALKIELLLCCGPVKSPSE